MKNGIIRYFKGTVGLSESSDGFILPLRLTEKQLKRYETLPYCIYPYATAGIELEFITSADVIDFEYDAKVIWAWWEDSTPKFDFYENGKYVRSADISAGVNRVSYETFKRGRKIITICFPHNASVAVKPEIPDDAEPTEEKKRKFLILGDSISQGLMGNTASGCYTSMIKRYYGAELLNSSVGGDTFDPDMIDEDLDFCPTDVIVELGTNDCHLSSDIDGIISKMRSMLKKVNQVYGGAKITVITTHWMTDTDDPVICEDYARMKILSREIFTESAKYGFTVIDGEEILPHDKLLFSDHAHPNDKGFSIYAENLIKYFDK